MRRGADGEFRKSKKPRAARKPGRAKESSKPLYSRRTIAPQTHSKHRVIPPATRPGFRILSLTKKSIAFVLDSPSGENAAIAGSFTNWEPLPMTKDANGLWRVTVQLAHGTYQYRFLVDGQWLDDGSNPRKTTDASGISTLVCEVL